MLCFAEASGHPRRRALLQKVCWHSVGPSGRTVLCPAVPGCAAPPLAATYVLATPCSCCPRCLRVTKSDVFFEST